MAKLRKAVCYRRLERPYTRKSKKRELSYVRGAPYSKITIFDMGNKSANFPYRVSVISKNSIQVRHNSIEAARIAINKMLSDSIGDSNYYFKMKMHPHHILRENTQAAGAGADRFSSGMAHSFGKPIGLAAQIKYGQELMFVDTTDDHLDAAKLALKQAFYKCSFKGQIEVVKK